MSARQRRRQARHHRLTTRYSYAQGVRAGREWAKAVENGPSVLHIVTYCSKYADEIEAEFGDRWFFLPEYVIDGQIPEGCHSSGAHEYCFARFCRDVAGITPEQSWCPDFIEGFLDGAQLAVVITEGEGAA